MKQNCPAIPPKGIPTLEDSKNSIVPPDPHKRPWDYGKPGNDFIGTFEYSNLFQRLFLTQIPTYITTFVRCMP